MTKRVRSTPQQRKAIYEERGVVCECCGARWQGAGRRFPIHHWSYGSDWYDKGFFSILCWECHDVLTYLGWGYSPIIRVPHGRTLDEIEGLAHEKHEQTRTLLEKWAPVYRGKKPDWEPRREDTNSDVDTDGS